MKPYFINNIYYSNKILYTLTCFFSIIYNVFNNILIPVEIKTLKFSDHNSDWRRAISLAKKQNIRTREILVENGVNIKIEYSLIILCSWCHGILNVEIIKQNM